MMDILMVGTLVISVALIVLLIKWCAAQVDAKE